MGRMVRSWMRGARRACTGGAGFWNERGDAFATALLALALAVIIVGTAAPNFATMYDTYSLHGAARRVVGDLRKARIQAATENNRYAVALVDAHTYTIHDDDNGDGVVDDGENVDTVNLSGPWPTIQMSFSGAVVFFASATAAGAQTVALATGTGETRRVTISRAGRVRVETPVAVKES